MKRLLLLIMSLLTIGCSQNHFNVPSENIMERVKVLGVAPIIVDADSDIRHPEKEQLLGLLGDMNRRYEQQLVRKIRATGSFYTVALMDGDPQQLFSRMLFRREKRDDATIQYNKYFWKMPELRDYLTRNRLDAVMLVVVSGLNRLDKVSSLTMLSSLTSEYNFLIMTAQIVDANGTVLWEYPNFRRRLLTYAPLINLQYPDFSEADANLLAKAAVKFKTIPGIRKALEQRSKDVLLRETPEPEAYGIQFADMVSFLKFDQETNKKDAVERQKAEPPRPSAEPARPRHEAPPPIVEKPAGQPAPIQPSTPAPATSVEVKPAVAVEKAPEPSKGP